MARLSYWDRPIPEPDEDDEALFEAIAVEIVPPKCLLGGAMVEDIAKSGEDPCSYCPCPRRDHCGGREQKQSLPAFLNKQKQTLPNTEAGTRKLQRQKIHQELNRLIAETYREKGE